MLEILETCNLKYEMKVRLSSKWWRGPEGCGSELHKALLALHSLPQEPSGELNISFKSTPGSPH